MWECFVLMIENFIVIKYVVNKINSMMVDSLMIYNGMFFEKEGLYFFFFGIILFWKVG